MDDFVIVRVSLVTSLPAEVVVSGPQHIVDHINKCFPPHPNMGSPQNPHPTILRIYVWETPQNFTSILGVIKSSGYELKSSSGSKEAEHYVFEKIAPASTNDM